MQMKGEINVNDDKGLEKGVEVIVNKALKYWKKEKK